MASMLKKLFSSKKKVAAISSKESIIQLKEQEDQLLRKQEHLEKQIQEQLVIAKENSSSNKRLALQALKRKKNLEKQQQHIDGVLQTLEYQKATLENASINAEVLDVLATTSKTLKISHKGMDIDTVQDIMEEISEQHGIGNEIAEAISQQNPLNIDEDELLAELDQLNEETITKEIRKLPPSQIHKSQSAPSKDAIFPARSKQKKEKLIAQMA